jgi:hypothetical protein
MAHSKKELHPKESSQISFIGPLSLMAHPRESSIQERAHKFVSEAPLIYDTSKRELNPRERLTNLKFVGFSHQFHIQESASSKRGLTNLF